MLGTLISRTTWILSSLCTTTYYKRREKSWCGDSSGTEFAKDFQVPQERRTSVSSKKHVPLLSVRKFVSPFFFIFSSFFFIWFFFRSLLSTSSCAWRSVLLLRWNNVFYFCAPGTLFPLPIYLIAKRRMLYGEQWAVSTESEWMNTRERRKLSTHHRVATQPMEYLTTSPLGRILFIVVVLE